MILFLSYVYIFLGLAYLFVPSIALELGRPKDLLKGGLFCLLAIFLLIKKNTFNNSDLIVILLNNFIFFIFIAELNLSRWNALSDVEKKSFKNISVIKNKLLLFSEALKLVSKNFLSKSTKDNHSDKSISKKVWVRSDKDNLKDKIIQSPNLVIQDSEVTNISKKDIIVDENY